MITNQWLKLKVNDMQLLLDDFQNKLSGLKNDLFREFNNEKARKTEINHHFTFKSKIAQLSGSMKSSSDFNSTYFPYLRKLKRKHKNGYE